MSETSSPDLADRVSQHPKNVIDWYTQLPAAVQGTIAVALLGMIGGGLKIAFETAPRVVGTITSPRGGPTPTLGVGTCSRAHRYASASFAGYAESTRPLLGEPAGDPKTVHGSIQWFGAGTMIWRDDTDGIYVFYSRGDWECYADPYDPILPAAICSNVPTPTVGVVPVLGFGTLWCACQAVRKRLNFGLADEIATDMRIIRHEKGEVIEVLHQPAGDVAMRTRTFHLYEGGRCR